MENENKKFDDHHCRVIERKNLKAELNECDANSDNKENRDKCYVEVKESSKKREKACMYS